MGGKNPGSSTDKKTGGLLAQAAGNQTQFRRALDYAAKRIPADLRRDFFAFSTVEKTERDTEFFGSCITVSIALFKAGLIPRDFAQAFSQYSCAESPLSAGHAVLFHEDCQKIRLKWAGRLELEGNLHDPFPDLILPSAKITEQAVKIFKAPQQAGTFDRPGDARVPPCINGFKFLH